VTKYLGYLKYHRPFAVTHPRYYPSSPERVFRRLVVLLERVFEFLRPRSFRRLALHALLPRRSLRAPQQVPKHLPPEAHPVRFFRLYQPEKNLAVGKVYAVVLVVARFFLATGKTKCQS